MSKLLVDMIEAVAYEKSMPEDLVRSAMEAAISALAKKNQKAPGGVFRSEIHKDGSVDVKRVWTVVDVVEDPDKEVVRGDTTADADTIETQVDTPQWTRQGLQVVKQVLAQKLKQGLRSTIAEAWQHRVGDVVMGVVKRVDKNRIVVDLGEPVEGVIGTKDRIPGEMYKIGQRCRAIVSSVTAEGQGPVISLSRSSEELLKELIAIEVPEVDMGQVIIKAVARDPGQRAKIAVVAGPGLRSSPAAVCVGMRGVRSQAVSNEVNGERLEFVEWKDDFAEFVIAALSPADIHKLTIDERKRQILVGVPQDNLARAIGSRGQNVRLATKLTGWHIDLMSVEDFEQRHSDEDQQSQAVLMSSLAIDEEIAALLVQEGFLTVEDVALSPMGDLLMIDELDEEIVTELQERATNALLLEEINRVPDKITMLSELDGLSAGDLAVLNKQGIETLEQLAELGLMDVIWNEDRDDELERWIMQARDAVGMI